MKSNQVGLVRSFGRIVLGERRYASLARWMRPRREPDRYGSREIHHDLDEGSRLVDCVLAVGKPAAIGKIGALELKACVAIGRSRSARTLSPRMISDLHAGAGVFPPGPEVVARFSDVFREAVREIDVLGVWFLDGERDFVDRNVPKARLIRLLSLEPYTSRSRPWSSRLSGKRVVVVSPFARSIESQYARRLEVWRAMPEVLPGFELRTVRAPLSDRLVKSPHPDWFAALDALKRDLAAEPFDFAIIGAGAFSIPLAVEAKKLGAIGIHLGGAAQLLFGILGARWDDADYLKRFINEAWVRPGADERPPDVWRIEGGAYW